MGEIDLVSFISQVGFPVGVATFLLIKVDKTLKEVNSSIMTLSVKLDLLFGHGQMKGGE